MTTGNRLALLGVVLAGATAYMAFLGASGSWRYYATVDECLSNLPAFTGQRIRVSGKVAANTLQIAKDRKRASFALQGAEGKLQVNCTGLLPDNLAEDREVVAEGILEAPAVLRCDKVMTQCAGKYQSASNSQTTR
ncbi:MAG: cytochrome c maturation protein CcmE [Pirellulales bacterium]|nr:cytochrome c maturation protein CcmE [Pirellulales bacterium]